MCPLLLFAAWPIALWENALSVPCLSAWVSVIGQCLWFPLLRTVVSLRQEIFQSYRHVFLTSENFSVSSRDFLSWRCLRYHFVLAPLIHTLRGSSGLPEQPAAGWGRSLSPLFLFLLRSPPVHTPVAHLIPSSLACWKGLLWGLWLLHWLKLHFCRSADLLETPLSEGMSASITCSSKKNTLLVTGPPGSRILG